MKNLTAAPAAAILLAVSATLSPGAIILSGNFNSGTSSVNTPTLTISQDIVFNITTGGNVRYVVFDGWVATSDGSQTAVGVNPAQNVAVVNGTTSTSLAISALFDNSNAFGGITTTDGLLQIADTNVASGTTFTIKAGSYTFASSNDFNSALNGTTFTGEAFLANASGTSLSASPAVPEPSSAILSILGAGLFFLRRRSD